MEVYIGNITTNTSQTEVISILKGFAKKARVRMVKQPMDDGGRAYFAVAEFDSERLARKAIKKIDGTLLHGQRIEVREFFRRSYNNERRAVNWRDKPWSGPERRKNDRRGRLLRRQRDDFEELLESSRRNTAEEEESVSVSAYSNMARKF